MVYKCHQVYQSILLHIPFYTLRVVLKVAYMERLKILGSWRGLQISNDEPSGVHDVF